MTESQRLRDARELVAFAKARMSYAARASIIPARILREKTALTRLLRGCISTRISRVRQELLLKMRLRRKMKLGFANICGAKNRQGNPCQCKRLFRGGRCRFHGGLSTGPKTKEGKHAIGIATRQRMASGQQERALAAFYAWLDAGGRQTLSRLAKARGWRNRTHRAGVGASWSLRAA